MKIYRVMQARLDVEGRYTGKHNVLGIFLTRERAEAEAVKRASDWNGGMRTVEIIEEEVEE